MHLIGIDEVGRGCLAGPVTVGAVRVPVSLCLPKEIRDSKLMPRPEREWWWEWIEEQKQAGILRAEAVSLSVAIIEKINILQAARLGANFAYMAVREKGDRVVLDGGLFLVDKNVDQETMIKADQKVSAVMLAAVYAKVMRDRVMAGLAEKYQGYGWERNAGYGTREHREAIQKLGVTEWHRKSFLH
ncbi:MAG: ribonuclease HII [Candidatus Harrisonbacteria bacterium]|nr:ribonuclease HII [Candidatus Harrisonbacteria bacterium]